MSRTALPLDPRTMDAEELTGIVRDALLALGGQTYVDTYAQDVKAEKHRHRSRPHPGEGS